MGETLPQQGEDAVFFLGHAGDYVLGPGALEKGQQRFKRGFGVKDVHIGAIGLGDGEEMVQRFVVEGGRELPGADDHQRRFRQLGNPASHVNQAFTGKLVCDTHHSGGGGGFFLSAFCHREPPFLAIRFGNPRWGRSVV